MDTTNRFLIGKRVGDGKLRLQSGMILRPLDHDEVVNLVGWLIVLGEVRLAEVTEMVEAIGVPWAAAEKA